MRCSSNKYWRRPSTISFTFAVGSALAGIGSVLYCCSYPFMCAKSYYNGTTSSGIVKITMDLAQDISNYHVIIAEDIIDTGRTLNDVVKLLQARNPLSLKVITLLDKPDRRLVDLKADISLFTIPDVFVIGYGLDCAEIYRNLPYIAEYDEEANA